MAKANRRARTLLLAVAILVIAFAFDAVGVLSRRKAPPTINAQTDMTTVVIPVEGMSCLACVARVKSGLKSITGVGDVEVSLVERNARVHFDPNRLSPDKLVATIKRLGYQAGTPTEAR